MTHDDVVGYQRERVSQPEVKGFDEMVDMTHVEHVDLPTPSGARVKSLAELSAEWTRRRPQVRRRGTR
jgi:hypothetical protein